MRGKKGSAHFEMIVGFVFFIGFVMFMFMFLSPWDSSSLPNSALRNPYDAFEGEVNTNLSSVFIKTNYTGTSTCFYIDLPSELFKYAITDESSFVTRLGGIGIDSDLVGGELKLDPSENFFRVAISPEFTDEGFGVCDPLDDFEIGGVVELEVVSYSKLEAMKLRYDTDYSGLKRDLKVADIFDFAIIPEDMDDIKMVYGSGIPDSVNVLAKDYVIKVLKSDGSVSNERISLRIW